jgi:hypothetical protein
MLIVLENYEVNAKATRTEYTYFIIDHMKFPSSGPQGWQPPHTWNFPRISYGRHLFTFHDLTLKSIQHFLPFPFALDPVF